MSVCVLGSINLDTVHRVERLPRPGETVLSGGAARFLGGKGANQAVASARAGAATRLIGAVGLDEAGRELKARLAEDGVDVSGVVAKPGLDTGSAFICVDPDGENLIVVSSGANAALAPEDLGGPPAKVLLAQLETPIDTLDALLRSPRAAGAIRILNGAPALPKAAAVFDVLDLLIVNETELAVFAGRGEASATEADCLKAADELMAGRPLGVIVTRGAAGAVAQTRQGVFAVGGHSVEAVDATGAGDCFCGALAARLSLGASLPEAMAFANAAAALSVGRPGASASMPHASEVDAWIEALGAT